MKQLLGFTLIVAVVFGGFVLHGGRFTALFKISEIAVIFGAAFGGMIIATKKNTLKLMLQQIKMCFKKSIYNKEFYNELLSLNFELLKDHQAQGDKALDKHIEQAEESNIFQKYPLITADKFTMGFIVDSYRVFILSKGKLSSHDIEAVLEEEITFLEDELEKPSERMHATAESAPGLGILAAVMGIILTMQGLDNGVAEIGRNIASALVGTFTGVFACYCLLGPLASAMANIAKDQTVPLQCVKSIITSYYQKNSPHFCVNAARKNIEISEKPSFVELENSIKELRTSKA